jgi:hypothetical protein
MKIIYFLNILHDDHTGKSNNLFKSRRRHSCVSSLEG